MTTIMESASDLQGGKDINVTPAVHRRILGFLNDAVSAADLEHIKPLFIHDHEGVPMQRHAHGGHAHHEPLLDHDTAQRFIELRNHEFPLGLRHLREAFERGLLERRWLDVLNHHLGESTYGAWSEFPQPIPQKGPGRDQLAGVLHAALLRTGKVLFITADETTVVWNPNDTGPGSFQDPLNQPHSMPGGYTQLCGHHCFLSDGRLLSVGGGGYGSNPAARWGYKFDPIAQSWARTANAMSDSRWYPTAVALPDRRVLVCCGHGTGEIDIYNEATDQFTRVELNAKPFPSLYPGLHLLPDNSIVYSRTGWGTAGAGGGPFRGDDQTAWFRLTGQYEGEWSSIAPAAADIPDRTKGMSVLLIGRNWWQPRVMVMGGSSFATNHTYEMLDASLLTASTAWGAPIPFPDGQHRSLCNATLLPDGNVFLSGGIQSANSRCALFDSVGSWRRAAEMGPIRDYHSMTLLLPSGHVMSAGWMNARIDIYSPPYLFRGPRPQIRKAPEAVRHGERFAVETPEARRLTTAVLVRPAAVTHQTDSEQRMIELPLEIEPGQTERIVLTAPDNRALAPGGYYMLFLLNNDAIPSVAQWIHLDPSMRVARGATVSVLQPFSGHVDLFATGADGAVISTFFEGDHWRSWFAIHGHVKMNPGAQVTPLLPFDGHVDLFSVTGNGTVMSTFYEHESGWRDWFPIHGDVLMDPRSAVTALLPFEGHVDLFATRSDGTVMSTFFDGAGSWRHWFPVDGATKMAAGAHVTALQPFEGHVDLFCTDPDGVVMSTFFEAGGGWRAWFPIDPQNKVHPGSVVTALLPFEGHVDLFATTSNGVVMSTFFEADGGWRPWFAIHGQTIMAGGAAVTALQPFEGHVDFFVTAPDGTVMSTFFDGGWRPWFPIHADVKMDPGSTVSTLLPFEGHVDLFGADRAGAVWSTFHDMPEGWRRWFPIP